MHCAIVKATRRKRIKSRFRKTEWDGLSRNLCLYLYCATSCFPHLTKSLRLFQRKEELSFLKELISSFLISSSNWTISSIILWLRPCLRRRRRGRSQRLIENEGQRRNVWFFGRMLRTKEFQRCYFPSLPSLSSILVASFFSSSGHQSTSFSLDFRWRPILIHNRLKNQFSNDKTISSP